MAEIEFGAVQQFDAFPAELMIGGKPYFLMREDGLYSLLSRRCPHAGDTVELEDGELVCPMHGWTFEAGTGRCHNVPSARLASYPVEVRNGRLWALIP